MLQEKTSIFGLVLVDMVRLDVVFGDTSSIDLVAREANQRFEEHTDTGFHSADQLGHQALSISSLPDEDKGGFAVEDAVSGRNQLEVSQLVD